VARFLGSARGRLLAVVDTRAALDAIVAALADAGVGPEAIEIFTGGEGAKAFDGRGESNGPAARLLRTIQFTLMDQMPDFAYYEAAAREGRFVISVRARGAAQTKRAVATFREYGAHFINRFALFQTEEYERWHGKEPDLPGFMRR
jgi:hypothetical protein